MTNTLTLQQLESFLAALLITNKNKPSDRKGMDVSGIFDRRSDDDYDFNNEIETKEQIRESLGTDDQKVIGVFERWWDKYKVSLHQLDSEVKDAEDVMWNHLKELGYE